ncbi:hypothetical protein niasHT_002091 [Heterodera trifolii]|uniref:Uncharacterized protein n=1 Tax=Heterodera trifolii TaxID=157864 RepID=A0ABD2M436_9BILA
MQRAVRRDAISTQKLYFRKTLAHCWHTPEGKPCPGGCLPTEPEPYGNNVAEMSTDEIVNGNTDFPGLVPQMFKLLNTADVNMDTRLALAAIEAGMNLMVLPVPCPREVMDNRCAVTGPIDANGEKRWCSNI